jgi:hypothetical protein
MFVGRGVRLGWLRVIARIQRRKGGVEMRMGIELVQIMVLLGWGLGLRRVEGKLVGKVLGMGSGMLLLLLLLLLLIAVRGC